MEVWAEIAVAESVWRSLREQGKEVHFEIAASTGRLSITERELDGNVLRELSALETLAIAASKPAALSFG
jgi:hypothetical protein